jgi:HK97 family phage portal protein
VIVKSDGTDVAVKSLLDLDWPFPPAIAVGAGYGLGFTAGGGNPYWPFMSIEQALGLPALLGVLLRVATGVGMLPQKVYVGDSLDRSVASDSWQYELIHDRPGTEHTPFTLKTDIAMSVAGSGYCCVRKYKSRGRVVELLPLDSARITPKRENGRLVFLDRTEGGEITRDQSDIIYVRGVAVRGSVVPLAPITLARMGILTGLKRQVFEGDYYDNNAEARVIVSFPQGINPDQAKQWEKVWNEQHQGLENSHGTGVIGGGAEIHTIPVSLVDAQFVAASRMTADQLGFIYGIPKAFLNSADRLPMTEEDWRYFVTFGLGWITAAIDQAFTNDLDLFPRGSEMRVETVTEALLKPDIQARYEAYKAARQAGWLTANEIRALENYPPLEGGDELQATPVGGAPNDQQIEQIVKILNTEFDYADQAKKQILARMLERAELNGNGHRRELLPA